MGSTMPYDEIDHVGNIKVGDIIKWADDKWLDDPNVDSKAKYGFALASRVARGLVLQNQYQALPGVQKKFSIRLGEGDHDGFFEPRLSY